MRILRKRGQSVTEYAIVFSVVAAAIIGMQIYLRRGLQAKQRDATAYLTNVAGNPGGLGAAVLATTGQYEPYYNASTYSTAQDATHVEKMTAGGQIARTAIDEKAVRTGSGTTGAAASMNQDDAWDAAR